MARINVVINYPSNNYGWDFGAPPDHWGNRAAWKRNLQADLQLFKDIGIFAVRWFILGDGITSGTGNDKPKQNGTMWSFKPPSLPREIASDFGDLLDSMGDLKLILSLVDFRMCLPGTGHAQDPTIPTDWVKGGRSEIVSTHHAEFFDKVLRVLLDESARSVRRSQVIYAWELINEPEWVTSDSGFGASRDKTVSRERMKTFLKE